MAARARISVSLLASLLLHAFLLFGIVFLPPISPKSKMASPPLDIILVNTRTAKKPKKADALAQASLEGGGNVADNRRAKSPLPPLETSGSNEAMERQEKLAQLEQESKHLLAAIKSSETVQSARNASDTHNLVQKSLQIARIEAQIDSSMDAYQKIPKETDVSPSTKEYRFARYVEDWRIKVERIGSLNFPEEAKRQQIFGSLLLNVCIKPDGSLDRIEIIRPSGYKVLDDAAVNIAKLAAPYAPLPKDIRKDTDILCIYRTWMFTRSNEMVSR